jgi:hypothetical protein
MPLAELRGDGTDGMSDYTARLDPDLRLHDFSSAALRALVDEVSLQGHLLVLSFLSAVERRYGTEAAVDAGAKQFCGVAGVAAERLRRAFALGGSAADVATALQLHPAFRPRSYTGVAVEVDGDAVRVSLDPEAPARHESGVESWISLLADGHDRAMRAIAAGVDPHWRVRTDGPGRWILERGEDAQVELPEVTLTKFSTGAAFEFQR